MLSFQAYDLRRPTFSLEGISSDICWGIPLGVEITSGESEAVIAETFSFLKTTFPGDTLYGKGDKGPEVCITDDCSAGFNSTWPDTTLLLYVCTCMYPLHYLQSWLSWLWDDKHATAKEDRQTIIDLVKKMLYSPCNERELTQRYSTMMQDNPHSCITPILLQGWNTSGVTGHSL